MKYMTSIVAFVGLAASIGVADAKQRYLGDAEIKKEITGKCNSYLSEDSEGTICYKSNGWITYNDSEFGKGSGRWQVKGGKICEKYDDSPEDSGCSKVRTTNRDGYYLFEDGTMLRSR